MPSVGYPKGDISSESPMTRALRNLAPKQLRTADVIPSEDKLHTSLRLEYAAMGATSPGPTLQIPTFWLRDSCPCPACRDPDSGQKNFSSTRVPESPKVSSTEVGGDGSLTVAWENDILSGGKEHISTWPAGETSRWTAGESPSNIHPLPLPGQYKWSRAMIEAVLPYCRISYEDWVAGGAPFWRALFALHQTGLIFVSGVPESEKSVEDIAAKVGSIQETFYGRTWDVVSKPRAENVAYTSQFLGLHQDLLYWPDTPKLQFLHCLANSCDGGESIFSDGVKAAEEVKDRDQSAFDSLTREVTPFHYNKDGHFYFRKLAVVPVADNSSPTRINWSPPFQGMPVIPAADEAGWGAADLLRWKAAAGMLEEAASASDNLYEYKLRPGECVVFDNHRILHGRNEFNTSQGRRWLKGCYVAQVDYDLKLNHLVGELTADPASFEAATMS